MASHSPEFTRRTATTLAIGSIFLWCWSGVCFTMGARLMGAMPYLTFMTATGSLTVFIMQAIRRKPMMDLIKLPPRVIFAGFWGVAFYTVMISAAFGMASDRDLGQVNLLNYLWPIWMVLLAIAMLNEKINPTKTIIGAVLSLIGVAIARGPASLFVMPSNIAPHLMAFVGGFLWALYCVLLRRWKVPEENGGTAFHFAVCAVMAALIALWQNQWHNFPGFSGASIFWILFGGIGPVGLGYDLWEIGVKKGSVHLISILAYFIPIGSSILIGLFFREALGPGLYFGACLIAAGAFIARQDA